MLLEERHDIAVVLRWHLLPAHYPVVDLPVIARPVDQVVIATKLLWSQELQVLVSKRTEDKTEQEVKSR